MVNVFNSKYPSVNLDGQYGQTVSIDAYVVNGVVDYLISVTEGSLTGGTSPAWTVSGSNPIITHITVKANNSTIRDYDSQMINNYMSVVRNSAFNGLSFSIPMTDIQYTSKKRIYNTLFPSYAYSQVKILLTIAPLSQITSGSPSGSTGTTLYLNEVSLKREQVTFKLFAFKQLQVNTALNLTGDNDLTNLLAVDGYYKSLMFMSSTAQNYTDASDSIINYIDLIMNISDVLKDEYWVSMKQENENLFGRSMPPGYAMMNFMEDNDFSQLLPLANPVVTKSANLKVNTSVTGYLYMLKNIYE